jgi:hypothetical protein
MYQRFAALWFHPAALRSIARKRLEMKCERCIERPMNIEEKCRWRSILGISAKDENPRARMRRVCSDDYCFLEPCIFGYDAAGIVDQAQ